MGCLLSWDVMGKERKKELGNSIRGEWCLFNLEILQSMPHDSTLTVSKTDLISINLLPLVKNIFLRKTLLEKNIFLLTLLYQTRYQVGGGGLIGENFHSSVFATSCMAKKGEEIIGRFDMQISESFPRFSFFVYLSMTNWRQISRRRFLSVNMSREFFLNIWCVNKMEIFR